MTMFHRDVPTYRYKVPREVWAGERMDDGTWVCEREVVIVAHHSGLYVSIKQTECRPGEMASFQNELPKSRRFYLGQDIEKDHGMMTRLVAESLAASDFRGQAEMRAVEDLFWKLVVKDESEGGLLKEYLPGLRAFYDRVLKEAV